MGVDEERGGSRGPPFTGPPLPPVVSSFFSFELSEPWLEYESYECESSSTGVSSFGAAPGAACIFVCGLLQPGCGGTGCCGFGLAEPEADWLLLGGSCGLGRACWAGSSWLAGAPFPGWPQCGRRGPDDNAAALKKRLGRQQTTAESNVLQASGVFCAPLW
eukprot:15474275-Alexandrium_andersonii.AAC.1